jgi:competence protein ComEC
LPSELDDALRAAGLTHIVVASGYNLTILVRFARRLFAKVSRFLALFASLALVAGFIAVTGLSPSMMRAGLVAGLALFAWYYGRKFHPLTLIALAAAVTGLINPSNVWGNIGWQLSFLSFAGVMILAPLLQNYFFGDKKPGVLRQIIGETLSAQIMTMPLIIYAFGSVSVVALAANVLVLPLVPLAMILVFAVGLFGYIFAPLAWLVAFPTQWLLDYMVWVATTLGGLEWSQLAMSLPFVGVVLAYGAITAIILYLRKATGLRLREVNVVE